MTLLAEPPPVSRPMVPLPYRVVERIPETRDSVTLVLVPADGSGEQVARAAPGQFDMVWAPGVGEVPISVSGHGPGGEILHTIREVGPVTAALCADEPGTVVGLRGPYGTAWGLDGADGLDVVALAGGIGLAPLRPLIRAVAAERHRFGRALVLLGGRTPDDLLYPAEHDAWRAAGIEVEATVDYATPGWDGHVGVVTRLVPRAPFDPQRAMAFVCGPEVMMRYAGAALVERGVAPGRVRVSLERNMRCAVGQCGHCQLGPFLVCRDGAVLAWEEVAPWLRIPER